MIHEDYYEFKRFEQEFVLELVDKVKQSTNKILKDAIYLINSSEYFYHVEMYIAVLKNYIYFKDEQILQKYLTWRYRVYYYRGIDLEFFLLENDFLKELCSFYTSQISYLRITSLYDNIEKGHKGRVEQLVSEKELEYEEFEDKLYQLAISGEEEVLYEVCLKESRTLEEFCIFCDEILSKVFIRIGYDWESTKISIAQEHLSSSTIKNVIERLFTTYEQNKNNHRKVIVTSAPKEFHGLGIQIGIKILQKLGFDVINLGCDLPLNELKNVIYEMEPESVLVSSTLLSYLDSLDLFVKEFRKENHRLHIDFLIVGHSLLYLNDTSILSFDKTLFKFHNFYQNFLVD